MTIAERSSYQSVRVKYQDKIKAETVSILVGGGEPCFEMRAACKDEEEAQKIGRGKLDSLKRGRATAEISVIGNPNLMAEASLKLSGFRSGVDGEWMIETVTHSFNGSGYASKAKATIR